MGAEDGKFDTAAYASLQEFRRQIDESQFQLLAKAIEKIEQQSHNGKTELTQAESDIYHAYSQFMTKSLEGLGEDKFSLSR